MPPYDSLIVIAVSDSLIWEPEKCTVVAMYKKLVVGIALLSEPQHTYVTYMAVKAGWENAHIATYVQLIFLHLVCVCIELTWGLGRCYIISSSSIQAGTSRCTSRRTTLPWYFSSHNLHNPSIYSDTFLLCFPILDLIQPLRVQGRAVRGWLLRCVPRSSISSIEERFPSPPTPLKPILLQLRNESMRIKETNQDQDGPRGHKPKDGLRTLSTWPQYILRFFAWRMASRSFRGLASKEERSDSSSTLASCSMLSV
jgi:hypothetical protein